MAGAVSITIGERSRRLTLEPDGRVRTDDGANVTIVAGRSPGECVAASGDRRETLFALRAGDTAWVFRDGVVYQATVEDDARARKRAVHHHGALMAPMPATVVAVNVKAGDAVNAGQILLVLEAMKMELPVRAPGDGIVEAVHCGPGDLVQPNVSLIDLGPREQRESTAPRAEAT